MSAAARRRLDKKAPERRAQRERAAIKRSELNLSPPRSRIPSKGRQQNRTREGGGDLRVQHWCVPPPCFSGEPCFRSQASRDGVRVKLNAPPPAAVTDPTPFSNQEDLIKEGRLDARHVVSRHVLSFIDTVKHKKLDVEVERQIGHRESSPRLAGAQHKD
jgi:hypothetical protein